MNRLSYFSTGIALATAASSLTLPPSSSAQIVSIGSVDLGVPAEIELEIWAEATIAVTNAVLYSARAHALVFADKTITTVTFGSDTFTLNSHGLETGDGPFYYEAGTTYPNGLAALTKYWAIKINANTFYLAASRADALAGTLIGITTNGTGTQKLVDIAADLTTGEIGTQRLDWSTHDGLLGLAGDGAIALAPGQGYSKRIPHSPRALAYALVATLDTGAVSAAIYPIQDL